MANEKFYTVEKEINGKKYKAQFNGISKAMEAMDTTYIEGTAVTSMAKMSKYVFEHVIVDPKNLTADDFDTLEEASQVVSWAQDVMMGNFRDEKKSEKA